MNPETEQLNQLIQEALHIRHWAYAPYSHYPVGAAVLAASGKIYSGVNIENAAYPSGTCAERVAIFKAVSEGEREILSMVVASENGGTPCGACRQVLSEFGPHAAVTIVDRNGKIVLSTTIDQLLPGAFGPEKLNI